MVRTLEPFEYYEPTSIKEASNLLQSFGEKARIIAGGVDLLARMRRREITPDALVSIKFIPGLDFVEEADGQLRIGALASIRSVELSKVVQEAYPLLYEAVHSIHSIHVKNTGTLIGNLCIATPASDIAAALIALDAKVKIAGPSGERTVPLEEFYLGVRKTVLQPGEFVTEVMVPRPSSEAKGAFLKLVRNATDIAKVNVAVLLTMKNGVCEDARVVLGSVAPVIFRAKKAEEALKGKSLDEKVAVEAATAAAEEAKPITDIRSTAEYRREMSRVLTLRAIRRIMEG